MCRHDNYIGTWRNPETKQMVTVWREVSPENPRDENYQAPMWHIHTVRSSDHTGIDDGDFAAEELTEEAADYIRKGGLVIPVYRKGYDEIYYSTGERITRIRDIPEQNSGDGFGFLSKKELYHEYGKGRKSAEQAIKYLQGELREYAAYVNDEVYIIVSVNQDGENDGDGVTIIYGDDERDKELQHGNFTEEMQRIATTTYAYLPKKSA